MTSYFMVILVLPFYVEDEHIKEFCENRCFENKDLINLKIAVAGFGAIIEVANLVMGAQGQCKGAHHAEMSFSPVIEGLENEDTDIDHLRSAYVFLEQAENYLRLGHYKQLMEALGKVNTSATYALASSGTTNVDDLVMAAKLLILVDVFSQSLTITRDKETKLVPINNLERSTRGNMIIHVTSHLHRLVKILNKKGLPMDNLRKVLTLSYQSNDNVKIHETYDKCAMWVALKTEILAEDTMKVTLPPLNIIPGPGGDSLTILNFGYFGIIYSIPLLRVNPAYGDTKYTEDDEIIEVMIEENMITDTSAESRLERHRDMTDMEFMCSSYEIWTPMDIRCIAPGAESGNVKSVKCLALCYEPRYTMEDMREALKIVGVAKSLYLSAASFPVDFEIIAYDMWRNLANSAEGSEMEHFIFAGSFENQEAMYEIDEDCGYLVGRLVTTAKKA